MGGIVQVRGTLRQRFETPAVDVELVIDRDRDALHIVMEGNDLGNWPLARVRIEKTRFQVVIDGEEWWFEPADEESDFAPLLDRLSGGTGPVHSSKIRVGRQSLVHLVGRGWRSYRAWSRRSARTDVALVLGGLCTVGIAFLTGPWVTAVLGAWGAGVTVFAATRFQRRSRPQVDSPLVVDLRRTLSSREMARAPSIDSDDEQALAALLGRSIRDRRRSPDLPSGREGAD